MLTFITEFFVTLAHFLASNLAFVVTIGGVGFIFYVLLTSDKARLIVKSLKGAIIKKLMQIPFIAEAVYDRTVSDYEKDLEKMLDHKKDLRADMEGYEREIEKNNRIISEYERKAQMSLAQGDEDTALEFASKVINAKSDNESLKKQVIPSMQVSVEMAEKRMMDIRMLIDKTKTRKKMHLRALKVGKLDEAISDSLMGYGQSSNEQLLSFFEEKAEYQKNRAIGARKEYESSLEYKERQLDETVVKQEARQMLEQLRHKSISKRED